MQRIFVVYWQTQKFDKYCDQPTHVERTANTFLLLKVKIEMKCKRFIFWFHQFCILVSARTLAVDDKFFCNSKYFLFTASENLRSMRLLNIVLKQSILIHYAIIQP